MEPRKQGKHMFNERDQALTSTFQLQSSPCGRSTPPVRYPRIPPTRPDEKRERARGGYTSLREKGELKRFLSQAWSSHTASTRSPPLLLPVRFLFPCPYCDTGIPCARKSVGN